MKIGSEKPTIADAVTRLVEALKSDPGYYNGWKPNLAMSFYDEALREKSNRGRHYLTNVNLHEIANRGADTFLTHLIKSTFTEL